MLRPLCLSRCLCCGLSSSYYHGGQLHACIVLLILNGMVLAIADDAVEAPAVLCVALPLQLPLHSVTRLGGIVQLNLACS